MKKLLMLLLSVVIAFSAVACGGEGGGGTGKESVIRIVAANNGVGVLGVQGVAKAFEEAYANKSYADGKMGVKVDIDVKNDAPSVSNIKTEAYHYGSNGEKIRKITTNFNQDGSFSEVCDEYGSNA